MHQNHLGAYRMELVGFLSRSAEPETLRGPKNLHFIRFSRRYFSTTIWGFGQAAVGDVHSRTTKVYKFSEVEEWTKRSMRSKVILKRKAREETFSDGRGQDCERKKGRNAVTWLWGHRRNYFSREMKTDGDKFRELWGSVVIKHRPQKWGLK